MSLNNQDGQMNPEEVDIVSALFEQKVTTMTKVLDKNSGSIHRWFWKALLAFNLALWSVALSVAFVLRFG